jgi:hypothetical protein
VSNETSTSQVAVEIVAQNKTAQGTQAAAQNVKQVEKSVGGLTKALGEYRKEQVQDARAIGFFTRELQEMTGRGNKAAEAVGRMAGAFASGGALGVALEAVKLGFQALVGGMQRVIKEAEEIDRKRFDNIKRAVEEVGQAADSAKMKLAGMMGFDVEGMKLQKARDMAVQAYEEMASAHSDWTELTREDIGLFSWDADDKLALIQAREDVAKTAKDLAGYRATQAEIAKREEDKAALDREAQHRQELARRRATFAKRHEDESKAETKTEQIEQRSGVARLQLERRVQEGKAQIALENLQRRAEIEDRAAAMQAQHLEDTQQTYAQVATGLMDVWSSTFASIISGSQGAGKAVARASVQSAQVAVQAAAASAAAQAAFSQAGIPILGPALAVGASGMVFGVVSALLEKIPSARGGFDIPAGVNPLTQLHEREMVLPAELADNVRRGGVGGGSTVINIHTIDRKGVREFVESTEFASALREARRNGRL